MLQLCETETGLVTINFRRGFYVAITRPSKHDNNVLPSHDHFHRLPQDRDSKSHGFKRNCSQTICSSAAMGIPQPRGVSDSEGRRSSCPDTDTAICLWRPCIESSPEPFRFHWEYQMRVIRAELLLYHSNFYSRKRQLATPHAIQKYRLSGRSSARIH